MAVLVNGKEIAQRLNASIKEKIDASLAAGASRPRLVSLTVGHNEEALVYVKMQEKAAQKVGIDFVSREMEASSSEEDVLSEIKKLNEDRGVTAVIVQRPLPFGVDQNKIAEAIAHEKDAEGIHPYNLGKIFRKEAEIVPCTPGAVMKILDEHHVDIYGKEVVVIGRSAIVGKPLSMMLLNASATITVCHTGTAEKGNLEVHASKADILVVAVGKAAMIKGDCVKPGAVVIDVGINMQGDSIVGDVDFKEAEKKASLITPVPGGVGPITVSILMRNVLRCYRSQRAGI